MINVTTLTIKEAGKLLRKKEISSVELTESYLERIEKLNPKLNAFITISKNQAIKEAEKADRLISQKADNLPLLGIPFAAKDLFSTKEIRTTAASKVLENYIPVYDATVIEKLKNVGAVILGKTNMDAWAHGSSGENSDFGPALNPYNLKKVPGGSSSGSAVAVAADLVLFSTGTDTGGSIRLPASFTNTVGLKPTYGRVSRYGIIAMASSLDSIGHFTKDVFDNALVLETTTGIDSKDSTTSGEFQNNLTKNIEKGVKNLKIGIPKEYLEGLDEKTKGLVKETSNILEKLGAKVSEISLPHTEYGVATYYIIQPSEVSSNLARYDGIRFGNRRNLFASEAKRRIILGTYTLSSGYYDAYYLKAMKVRRLIKEDFENAFKTVDLILAPTSTGPAFNIGEKTDDPLTMYLSDIYTVNVNLAGVPSLNIPAGFIGELPVGVQLIGPNFSEELIYQAAYALEQKRKLYERKPKLA